MSRPAEARERALRRLVERAVISERQAAAVRAELAAADAERPHVRWAEIAGYVGGALALTGAVSLVAAVWADLERVAWAVVLTVLTLALAGGGVLTAGGPRAMTGRRHRVPPVRRRLAGVLAGLASVTAALAVQVALDTDLSPLAGAVGLLVAAAGYAVLPAAVLLVACAGMSVWTIAALLDLTDWTATTGNLLVLGLGLLWIAVALTGVLTHRALAHGLGAAIALYGAQMTFGAGGHTAWIALTLAVAVLFLLLYQRERATVLLVAGVLGCAIAVTELVWDWTEGAIGASGTLLLAGVVLLVVSAVGIRLHRAHRSGD
ncbi:DUF2157 domain-containing protein [Marinactinospora rubrisoli]|uniref:DUF2157 domain-containing protein n=1 Tax=Marinactinospora rubrisoli TaxID=2715399 RepID=A0ABW2KDX9_9ACTN